MILLFIFDQKVELLRDSEKLNNEVTQIHIVDEHDWNSENNEHNLEIERTIIIFPASLELERFFRSTVQLV